MKHILLIALLILAIVGVAFWGCADDNANGDGDGNGNGNGDYLIQGVMLVGKSFYDGTDRWSSLAIIQEDDTDCVGLTVESDMKWVDCATFSPDGSKILYCSNCHSSGWSNWDIYIMNTDGSSQTRLTNTDGFVDYPVWSPNGLEIAFQFYYDENTEIFVMNTDGSNQTNLTNNIANDSEPAWSPDGSKIAFKSNRDGNYNIYIMNTDGSDQVKLSNNIGDCEDPVWSPDGSKILFECGDGSSYWDEEIYVINVDGSDETNLTNYITYYKCPQWSPDGYKIAFIKMQAYDYEYDTDLYIMNEDGSNQTNLTNDIESSIDEFIFSPDGSKIAYGCLFIMNVDGSEKTRIMSPPEHCGIGPVDWIQ